MKINAYLFKHKTTPFIDSASIHCTSSLTQDEIEVLGGNISCNKIEELHTYALRAQIPKCHNDPKS